MMTTYILASAVWSGSSGRRMASICLAAPTLLWLTHWAENTGTAKVELGGVDIVKPRTNRPSHAQVPDQQDFSRMGVLGDGSE